MVVNHLSSKAKSRWVYECSGEIFVMLQVVELLSLSSFLAVHLHRYCDDISALERFLEESIWNQQTFGNYTFGVRIGYKHREFIAKFRHNRCYYR